MKRLLFCQECNSFFKTVIADKEKMKQVQEKLVGHPTIKEEVLKRGSSVAFVLAS